ncbi:MAG TPA: TadE/TadG family type IV pilus assembly protein [Oceanobacillus sp.]|nr:TadE/TadG family type IV pilus assembly protein [Oceanobacillus sp.]
MQKKFSKRKSRLESGQSLIEFAIGLVVLLLLLSGLLDLGRVYFTYVALEDGAGEAALYLAINPACPNAAAGPQCADPNNAEYRARYGGGGEVDWSIATIKIDIPIDALGNAVYDVGEPVSVTIEYPFQLLTPVIPKITGLNPITLTTHASQVIIGE